MDRLCREGVLFSEAIAASPGSAASHAALLTSRYPVSNGVWANFHVLDHSVEAIAETMRARGYRTGAFLTNTFLGRRFQFDQGFETFVESGLVERLEEPSAAGLFRSLALVQISDRIRLRFNPGYDPSFETALAWLAESARPTFLFVHLMDVHSPYVPPHPFGPLFGADPEGSPEAATQRRNRYGWRPSVEAYLAEIRSADTKIGRLRTALAREGRLDQCVLALTSDHGENLLDHPPPFSHGTTIFDATLRILAAVRAPRQLPGGTIRACPFDNVDVLPTVFALLDWPPPAAWEGRAFCGPREPTRRFTFASLDRDFTARSPDWKLVLREDGTRAYYDLRVDPGETRPTTPPSDLAAHIVQVHRNWLERHATDLYLGDADRVEPEQLSPETIETLRTLGYIE
jgi:arylsulfatase A-like enzyme